MDSKKNNVINMSGTENDCTKRRLLHPLEVVRNTMNQLELIKGRKERREELSITSRVIFQAISSLVKVKEQDLPIVYSSHIEIARAFCSIFAELVETKTGWNQAIACVQQFAKADMIFGAGELFSTTSDNIVTNLGYSVWIGHKETGMQLAQASISKLSHDRFYETLNTSYLKQLEKIQHKKAI